MHKRVLKAQHVWRDINGEIKAVEFDMEWTDPDDPKSEPHGLRTDGSTYPLDRRLLKRVENAEVDFICVEPGFKVSS
jgi:hypothetical protein